MFIFNIFMTLMGPLCRVWPGNTLDIYSLTRELPGWYNIWRYKKSADSYHWLNLATIAALFWAWPEQWGEITCQFLLPGGSMVPRYALQLLFSEISQNCFKKSTTTKAREKISTDLESLVFIKKVWYMLD